MHEGIKEEVGEKKTHGIEIRKAKCMQKAGGKEGKGEGRKRIERMIHPIQNMNTSTTNTVAMRKTQIQILPLHLPQKVR